MYFKVSKYLKFTNNFYMKMVQVKKGMKIKPYTKCFEYI